ncbi:hypothetical protein MRX96_015197 [Rhipicephalus microplus]
MVVSSIRLALASPARGNRARKKACFLRSRSALQRWPIEQCRLRSLDPPIEARSCDAFRGFVRCTEYATSARNADVAYARSI